jgi:FKBP-type peptidyl-prolyl cis-trans isomerase FklB
MKQASIGIIGRMSIACVMVAVAPLVGAQSPTPAPGAPAAVPAPAPAQPPAPSADQASYLFGLTFGEQLHRFGISDQLSIDAVTRGMKEGLQGKKSAPADQQQLQAFVREVMAATVTRNQAAAAAFLDHNGHEKGVTTTSSGLQYKIITAGDSKAPAVAPTDQVTVQYRGTLLDGSEFDSTYARGAPMTFAVNGVIPGWQEALLLMKPGDKWQIFVPPALAYGANPQRGIPGGSLLKFEVELVSVKSNTPPATSVPAPAAKPAPKSK